MSGRRIEVSRACQHACRFCDVADRLDRRAVDPQEAADAVDRAAADGVRSVVLSGGEPTLSRAMIVALNRAKALGLAVELRTNGRHLSVPANLGRLVAVGVQGVTIPLHAVDPTIHRHLVGGDPLAYVQALSALRQCAAHFPTTLSTVLTAHNRGELAGLVALCAELGVDFELRRLTPSVPVADDLMVPVADTLRAWQEARTACAALRVTFTARGFDDLGLLGSPVTSPPVALDVGLRAAIVAGLPPAEALAGVRVPDRAALTTLAAELSVRASDLPFLLAARRLPVVNLDPARGGLGLEPTPDDLASLPVAPARAAVSRVAVVVPHDADRLTVASTLPALAEALKAAGVHVDWHSPFRAAPGDPTPLTPPPPKRSLWGRNADLRPYHPGDGSVAPVAWTPESLRALDLGRADAVLTWGWPLATLVRAVAPSVARWVVDLAELAGFDGVLGPHDRLITPRADRARVLLASGLAWHQILLAPAPVHAPHLPTAGAARGVDLVRAGPLPAGWTDVGTVALQPLDLLGVAPRARLLWVPAPRGVSPEFFALAAALGLPVVASEGPVAAAHLRPGSGWLLRPDQPAAHGALLEQLRTDDAAVGEASRRARAEASGVDTLVHRLLGRALPASASVPRWPW